MKETDTKDVNAENTELNIVKIYSGLGWMITVFEPTLFKFWEKDTETHFICKLQSHRYSLNKNLDQHFPAEKINLLKEAIDDFIKINTKFRADKALVRRFRLYFMRKSALKVWNCATILANSQND